MRGDSRPSLSAIGIGLVLPIVQHRRHHGADVVGWLETERRSIDPSVLVIGEFEEQQAGAVAAIADGLARADVLVQELDFEALLLRLELDDVPDRDDAHYLALVVDDR